MAPKKDKKKSSDLLATEEKLQAVVLTDSYETRFMPLANEKPRCLLPLANSPLIEYTFEFLATAEVGEVFLMCCSHADKIEKYVQNSKWSNAESPFRIKTIASPESQSVGDVMRDLDTKGVIKKDFLLISGDVVCNLDFQAVLDAHNERKQHDKNAIMTMILREASGMHRTRPRNEPGVFILDENTNRCLRYESAKSSGSISLDAEVLQEHESVAFRNDLIDCQIDICTVDIPALFQENFDYDKIRSDFVRGILTSDLLGKTIYAHIINDKYAARVQSLQTYDAISKDVIGRYAYPIAPDSNLSDKFSYDRGNIYKEQGVVLAQSCHLQSNCVVGSATKIGEKSQVRMSTIGRNCVIGNGVVLDGAYIWDNVIIEDNVTIINSIVADKATIKSSAEVRNSIVSFGVVVGSGRPILDVKLTASGQDREEAEREESEPTVGEDGVGFVYHEDSEDESDSTTPRIVDGLVYNMSHLNISDESLVSDDDEESAAQTRKRRAMGHRRTASRESASYYTEEEYEEVDDEGFIPEAVASVERSISEGHAVDVAVLELNTLRMTMNASYEEVREATMTALLREVIRQVNVDGKDVKNATKTLFEHWSPMISKQIFELADQVHLLQVLLEQCAIRPQGGYMFLWAVDTLYDEELVDEDHINEWASSPASESSSPLRTAKQPFQKWLEWLNTAESEEESDDE